MKSRVVFMALLCLLLIFTGAYADPAPVGKTLTYNGTDQVLVDTSAAQSPDSTKYQYIYCRLNGEEPWQVCDEVTGKDADEYDVEYIWSGRSTPTDSTFPPTGTVNATIEKAAPKYEAPEALDSDLTYTGSEQDLLKSTGTVTAPETGRVMFLTTYTDTEGNVTEPADADDEMPVGTAAGKYEISWYVVSIDNPNYNDDGSEEEPKGTITVNIAPATGVVVTINGKTFKPTYDGNEHVLNSYKDAVITYDGEAEYTTNDFTRVKGCGRVTGTDAGEYPQGLTAECFENKNPNFADVTFEVNDGQMIILPLDVEVIIFGNTYITDYNGREQSVEGYYSFCESELFKGEDYGLADGAVAKASGTDVQEEPYMMGLTPESFVSLNDNFNPTFEVTDGYVSILPLTGVEVSITGKTVAIDYDGKDHVLSSYESAVITLDGEETDLYTEADFSYDKSCGKATGTDAGTYPQNMSEECFENVNTNFEDVTFNVTPGQMTINPLKVNVSVTGTTEEKVYNGEEQSVEGFTFTADSELFKEEDFGLVDGAEAKASGKDVQDDPYTMSLTEESFESLNENFAPIFNVTDGSLTIIPLEGIKVAIEGKKASVEYNGDTHNLSSYKTPVTITLNDEPTELYKEGAEYFTRDNTCGKAAMGKIDAGSYPLELKSECFKNVNPNFENVVFEVTDGELTITPLDVTVTITGTKDELTYTGEELSVEGYTATATSEIFNVEEDFGLADGKEAVAKGTNVQEEPYMMGLTADSFVSLNDNFNPTFEVTDGEMTIKEKAGVVVTIAGRQVTVTYTGEERVLSSYEEPVITLDGEPTTLYTTADFTRDKSCGIARGTDVAGSPYPMNLTGDCFTNTNSNFEDVQFVVTDGQINIIPLDVEVTITGNSEEKVYNGEEQSVEGFTFTADSDLFTEEDFGLVDGAEAKASGKDVQDDPYTMGLTEESFESLNENFAPIFNVTDGELTITPLSGITVAIEGKKASVPYDGDPHNLFSFKTPVTITLDGEPTELYTENDFERVNTCGKDATKKTEAGTYPMNLTAECFTNKSDNFTDVSFEVKDGELTITQKTGVVVAIEGKKGSVYYDGKEHNLSSYNTPVITIDGQPTNLYTVDDFERDADCGKAATKQTEVGTYPMELTDACFTNKNDNFADVTFNVTDGKLTIKPQAVTITAGSTKKYVYDGTALTNSEFTVEPEVDHEFTVTMTADSTVTDASKDGVPNVIATVDGVEVVTGEPTVIGNYTVVTVDGTLQVSRKPVTLTAADAEQVYNGSALTSEDFTWTELAETDDHVFAVTMTEESTITNVGTQANTIGTVDGKDVSAGGETAVGNYLITIVDGELTVTPKEVTITAASGEWEFDGHTHRLAEFTATDLEEGDDHEFEVTMTADSKVTRATTKPNVIATVDGVAVTTGEETEVGNYLVTTVDGTLTVTQKGGIVVTITGNHASVTYDGKEHTAFKYDKVPVEITLNGQPTDLYTEADFERDSTCGKVTETNAGTYPMGLSADCFTNKNGNFENVTFEVTDGDLTIKPAEVTLSWNSAQSFLYTGKVHGPSAESITIEGLAEGEDQTKVATITVTDSPMTDAGSYTAKAEVTFDPANYVLAEGAQTEFPYIIHKATITVDPAPVLKEGPLPYTGSYQALLESLGGLTCDNNADPCPGSIIYVLNGQWETNPDENPSADAVGEYTVSYYVTDYDTNNYQCDATKETPVNIDGTVEIVAADVALTWTLDDEDQTAAEKEISYDGKDHTIGFKAIAGSADVSDKMVLSIKKDGAASGNPAKDSGVYTAVVSVKPEEAANFNLDEAQTTFTLTINKIEAEISFGSEATHVYDGTEWLPEIIVKESTSGNTVTDPALETKVTAVESELGYPNVGKYKLTVTNKDPNMAADPAEVEFEITKADYVDNSPASDVTEPNTFAVTPLNTTYSGEYQPLAEIAQNQSTWGSSEILFAVVDENGELVQKAAPAVEDLTLPLPMGLNVGTYELYYRVVGDANHNDYPADGSIAGPLTAVIAPADLADAVITLNPSTLPYTGQPVTANPTVTFNKKPLRLGEDYEISGNVETEEGMYTLVITAVEGSNFTGTNSLVWRIRDNAPQKVEMFRVGDPADVCLRCGVLGNELPATGFPTRVNVPLAVKPEGLNYTSLNMRIQIPSLDVDVELAGVPTIDGAWKVEWLEDRAGLLSGTALPGEGYSIVAAHNTLNAEETGPFVMLSSLENNDTIFVNASDGSLRLFRVYANELLAPNDMEKLASIAEQEANTLVLVTCENESVDGGYLNRRVVFAKPLN